MSTPLIYPTTTNAVQKTLDASLLTGVTASATLNNVTGIQNLKGLMVIDRVDGNNNLTPTKREYVSFAGTSGSTVVTLVRGLAGSTDQDHAVGAIVEFVNDVVQQQAILDGLGLVVGADGTLSGSAIDTDSTMAADSDTLLPSQKATKAYADQYQYNSMSRQALINGNFDIWQRGTTVTNLDDATFESDRWRINSVADSGTPPSNIIHSRQVLTSGDIFGSFYHYRIAPDGAGSGFGANALYGIQQFIENGTRHLCGDGKKVTVSFYAKSSIADKKIGVRLAQNYGSEGSPTAQETINGTNWTLTSSWTKYTHTFTTNTLASKTFGTANDDSLKLGIFYVWGTTTGEQFGASVAETFVGSGNIDIAQVQLCAGDVALPFQPKSFEEELRACMRYYEKTFTYATAPAQNVGTTQQHHRFPATATGAATQKSSTIYYKVPKRTSTPTITFYNPAATNAQARDNTAGADCSSTTAVASSEFGFHYDCTGNASTAIGNSIIVHWTAESEL